MGGRGGSVLARYATVINQAASNQAALVLSGGGARGAYQIGVLKYIAGQRPDLDFPILTGVSAGAINATFLAGRQDSFSEAVDQLADHWTSLSTKRVFRSDIPSLAMNVVRVLLNLGSGGSNLAPRVRGLVATDPLRQFLEGLIDSGAIAENIDAGRLSALAVSATSYGSGRTVTFIQAEESVQTWERVRRMALRDQITTEHVMASAAIPMFFPACAIDGQYYGDGSLRQSHPLAPAIHLGADRILAISSRWRPASPPATETSEVYPPAAQLIGLLLNSIFLDNLDVDAERLRRINYLLGRVPESRRWLLTEKEVKLLVLRPSSDIGKVAKDYERSMPASVRYLIRGLGTRRISSSDLVSYLLFESDYLSKLIALGERDAERNWLQIRRFLDPEESGSDD